MCCVGYGKPADVLTRLADVQPQLRGKEQESQYTKGKGREERKREREKERNRGWGGEQKLTLPNKAETSIPTETRK